VELPRGIVEPLLLSSIIALPFGEDDGSAAVPTLNGIITEEE
jgi:hypothetical protein